MYDELIKGLRMCEDGEKCDLCPKWLDKQNGGLNACTSALSKEAADAIEDLENKLNLWRQDKIRRWIPVTERLPEIHTDVLVVDKAHDMAVGSLEKLWDGEVWVCPFSAVDDEHCRITHWMPLPQAPESEGKT